VQDGAFDYVILDGGMGEEARRLASAIKPLPASYHLSFRGREPTLGQNLEIYDKQGRSEAAGGPRINISSPTDGALIAGEATEADGSVKGAQPGWYIRAEIFTDRWYDQGDGVPLGSDGTFKQRVHLGGEGAQQCNHLLRVRAYDENGELKATALNYGITRANADGSAPACR
jgi:hypothetical protein